MSDEVTIPLLPCADLDDMIAFYRVLGFETTYQQRKPNPYAALRREDLHLHFFEMPGFVPADSYSSCLVLTSDPVALHAAFAAGMRAAYGKDDPPAGAEELRRGERVQRGRPRRQLDPGGPPPHRQPGPGGRRPGGGRQSRDAAGRSRPGR